MDIRATKSCYQRKNSVLPIFRKKTRKLDIFFEFEPKLVHEFKKQVIHEFESKSGS